jgi:hypothetical protein
VAGHGFGVRSGHCAVPGIAPSNTVIPAANDRAPNLCLKSAAYASSPSSVCIMVICCNACERVQHPDAPAFCGQGLGSCAAIFRPCRPYLSAGTPLYCLREVQILSAPCFPLKTVTRVPARRIAQPHLEAAIVAWFVV